MASGPFRLAKTRPTDDGSDLESEVKDLLIELGALVPSLGTPDLRTARALLRSTLDALTRREE